jgi:hypothetical protein
LVELLLTLRLRLLQHLLVAADQYQLSRLRRICEKRLCDTVDVETVATTLALAEQNHAEELKKVGGGAGGGVCWAVVCAGKWRMSACASIAHACAAMPAC